jgi:hypothetical protein
MDRPQRLPQSMLRPWYRHDARKDHLSEQLNQVQQPTRARRNRLDQNIRQVKIGRAGDVLGEHFARAQWILYNIHQRARRGGRDCRDEEDLNDLEGEIALLDE